MRITVGSALLGDLDERFVGGFVASADGSTNRGRGTCTGMARINRGGSTLARFTVPAKLTFPTVSAAQKWVNDTAKTGVYEGLLRFVYADGTETRFNWAVARPEKLSHQGVLVSATWQIEAGERLT